MAETTEAVASEQDDVSFLRTDDIVCLSCTLTNPTAGSTERVCLAAEGFGNRTCFLETISEKDYPPDMASCMLVIEQALSVRALQEMVSGHGSDSNTQSGHRTLLYGHAVLLRHVNSNMYLTCLNTTSPSDKLAFDVGLRETAVGEATWWTIHPASKQRSDGEKVRVGDDLILVSVATERYLHSLKSKESSVIASFHQTLWTVLPVASGSIRNKSVSFVFGQEIVRFLRGHDECLAVPENWSIQNNTVVYEGGEVLDQARSLWRLELIRPKWAGGFLNWKQAFRLQHITSGCYLSVANDESETGTIERRILLVTRDRASVEATAFFIKADKDDKEHGLDDKEKEEEGMGPAAIKYAETYAFLQHAHSGYWLSYKTLETTKRGVGKVEEKFAVLLEEGHMDDALTFGRAQPEESRSARVIRKCAYLFHRFNRGLDTLQAYTVDGRASFSSAPMPKFNLKEMLDTLQDLIAYFSQPEDGMVHEAKQIQLRALRNRQNLFQQEGVLSLILDTIDKIGALTNYLQSIQEDEEGLGAAAWEEISNSLYLLIAAMIKGNHGNCAQFAQLARLNWLFSRLSQQGSEGVLDVLHCVLIDSPEALNMIREEHIQAVISLLDRSGRDPKVLDVLAAFCVGNDLAVRSSQNNICQHLLPGKDLLLQTKLVDHVSSIHPNIYVAHLEGSAMFKRWYYEAVVDHVEQASNQPPHLRIGWANTDGYSPYPGGGERWGGNGVGDDMFSVGFDGASIWTGGHGKLVRVYDTGFQKGDVVGCLLDLTVPEISFTLNGVRLRASAKNFNTTGMFYPVVSMSARSSCRFMLGSNQGRLKHGPPPGFSAVIESLQPNEDLRMEPAFYFGEINRSLLAGPHVPPENPAFVPKPIDTTGIAVPNQVMQIRDRLAENIHELWSVSKIEAGWTYSDVRNDEQLQHNLLVPFSKLPPNEKQYDITLSLETLKTLIALGYHVTMLPSDNTIRIRQMKLSSTYTQSNGYKPAPLDLTTIQLTPKMEELVDLLAENIHNVWARNRIEQGWTYGLSRLGSTKRSPHLVPYEKVDESIRRINRGTATEVVRTLIAFGYSMEPPSGESHHKVVTRNDKGIEKRPPTRSYRAEKTYAVAEGKWYYEFEVLTSGYMKVGWALMTAPPGVELGSDSNSYGFEGSTGRKWHQGQEAFGRPWQIGDIVGCLLDLHDRTMRFSINGELLLDSFGNEVAFENVGLDGGSFVPACTLGANERGRFNFGQDIHSLKFFTACGLQEGYEPFCVNMTKAVPFWYDRAEAVFVGLNNGNSMLEVNRVPGTSSTPPAIKLTRRAQGLSDRLEMEFLRLSLPVCCRDTYLSPQEKQQQQMDIDMTKRMHLQRGASLNSPQGRIAEQMMTGGFNVNDIQNLTSARDHFVHEDSMDAAENGGVDLVVPNVPSHTRLSIAGDKAPRQRGIMKKTHSLESPDTPDGASTPYVLSTPKRMPRSASTDRFNQNRDSTQLSLNMATDCCMFLGDSGVDEKGKKRGRSPFTFLTNKIKQTAEKARSASRERGPNRPTTSGQGAGLRTPDITLAAGNMGNPVVTIRGPTPNLSLSSMNDILGGEREQRVAFGMDTLSRSPTPGGAASPDFIPPNEQLFSLISEFHYAIRIFPGQESKCVFVGWVTSDFHHASSPFSLDDVRRSEVRIMDMNGQMREQCHFRNSYLVCAADLQEQVAAQSNPDKHRSSSTSTPGIVIGTTIDVATGLLTFSINGREVEEKHQVQPGTKIYPAVFVEPTSKDVLQFEFIGTKTALPITSHIFHRDKSLTPSCPPRLRVLTLKHNLWSRVPSQSLRVHDLKMSDVRGWSMLCDDPVSILALHIPEEDRCIDILELIENDDLLQFHAHTLMLYCAICSHGNYKVAHSLVKHVDQRQLLFAIQNPYLSGELRKTFYDLLIAVHLDTHAKSMFSTREEFVIPVAKRPAAGKHGKKAAASDVVRQQSSVTSTCTSIRPALDIKDRISSEGEDQVPIKNLTAPSFPMSILKAYVFDALEDGVRKGTAHCRDPVGGSYDNLFCPLLKIIDQLLLIGYVTQEDLDRLLVLVHPTKFKDHATNMHDKLDRGLLDVRLDEPVKLQLSYILQDLCDQRIRRRIEEVVLFSEQYVGQAQKDQLMRYIDIKQSDLPSSVAAKKTKEFRCPPKEQMKMLLSFKHEDDSCPSPEELRAQLMEYHSAVVARSGPAPVEKATEFFLPVGWSNETLTEVIKETVIGWAAESHVESEELIKEMFALLHRQYDGISETLKGLEKTYVISTGSNTDVSNLLVSLGRIRTLLSVQMGPDEEEVLRTSLWELMNNKVFFQHPDLIGMLKIHENVMTVMMNTIGKAQNMPESAATEQTDPKQDSTAEMVVACCKFLCYFCRTSRTNQKAMFEHLGYLLDNSSMLLHRPSLRGSAPLDVAYSALMENSELALSLQDNHLEKIATYLSRCGLQSNVELTRKGHPDIGWDPVEGERYIDFLRFCVWVGGESMEENANLVVRLLIRRPECLGPALRGGGVGLYVAMKEAIGLSERNAATMDPAMKEDEDYVDMGEAILNFYSVLVDLLGRCSPEGHQLAHARSDSVRARAILQSLVPLSDLESILSMKFFVPNFIAMESLPRGEMPDAPPSILPNHKQAVLVFLERVYGVEDPTNFFRLLEESFLPDMRAGTMMEGGLAGESDISLALNRYLCNSVLPLLTRHSHFFADATQYTSLLEATLHTGYTLSKVKNLTKNQREVISEFLLALIREIEPSMMERLLRKLIIDVSALSEHTIVALKMLTSHFDRCAKYYGSTGGFGNYGAASEAEKRLTMMLFSRIFDSLAGRNYDPELFNYALPCLSAIGSALPPDYALVKSDDDIELSGVNRNEINSSGYHPHPVETSTMFLNPDLNAVVLRFSEHYHDNWALKKYESGWGFAQNLSDDEKVHPYMQPFNYLPDYAKEEYRLPTEQALKTIQAWNWVLEKTEDDSRAQRGQVMKRRPSRQLPDLPYGYMPRPVDLNNVTLNREMQMLAERLAENAHEIWAVNTKAELSQAPAQGLMSQLVPFDMLTDREKRPYRERSQELLQFLIYNGYKFRKERRPSKVMASNQGKASAVPSEIESRFAYSLLEKLLHYCNVTLTKMKNNVPSRSMTRRNSYTEAAGDVKFFNKVVLPLVEQYFRAQRNYFLYSPESSVDGYGTASPKEKEMVASLFCRLAMLVRTKVIAFGHDIKIAVECLQVLVQAIDCSSLIRNSLDFVRTSFLTFFNQAASDLANTVNQLKAQNFPPVRGTTPKQSTSLGYVEGVLLRLLTTLFDHIGTNNFGKEILVNDIQIASYSILDSLYTLGTHLTLPAGRKMFEEITIQNRPLLGACLAAFASTFPVAFLEPEFNTVNPFCVMGRAQEQSLQAQDVMNRLSASLPTMEILMQEVETFANSGDYQTSPHIIDVILPMLCSYLSTWYTRGPDNTHPDDTVVTKVAGTHLNTILTHSLNLIYSNIGNPKATWMERIAAIVGQIVIDSKATLLTDRVLPIAVKLHENLSAVQANEEVLRHGQRLGDDLSSVEAAVGEEYAILVRDLYAAYPIIIRYAEIHKANWIKENNAEAEQLYGEISTVFNHWMKSQHFKREELNFLSGHEVDVNALISAGSRGICRLLSKGTSSAGKHQKKRKRRGDKRGGGDSSQRQSLVVVSLKRLLPVGLNLFTGREQEIVQKVKERMLANEPTEVIENFVGGELMLPDQPAAGDAKAWQRLLYIKIGKKKPTITDEIVEEEKSSVVIERILAMSKVLYGLHLVDHPPANANETWKKLVSTQRKRAIIACFRMVPLHSLPRHRAINIFIPVYRDVWLSEENAGQELLVNDLTEPPPEDAAKTAVVAVTTSQVEEIVRSDQLTQLVNAFSRAATTEHRNEQFTELYLQYADILSKSCGGAEEEDEEEGGEEKSKSEQESEKEALLATQNRLADRGVAEMVLMFLSSSNGEPTETVWSTLTLGISILRGGNKEVQRKMYDYLREKRDVGFFTSMSALMNSCKVLNLDEFERIMKAEGLGVSSGCSATEANDHDADNTCKIFRFLQLLCEGHNLDFQNYLRTQQGNTATVNLIISTVDYLLRLQESVMDFYWHYSSKELIDPAGIKEISRAIRVASQVFNTLTESIQGPCPGNQLCLANSRLWDAVGGFLFLFAHMQDKLSKAKDETQFDLLKEFLDLQNDMVTMLISMLEGNIVNGPIGKQMVDSLAESSQNLEMIIKFYDIFLKLDELVNSPTFKEYDPNHEGWITVQDLKRAMESQKIYKDPEQIAYLQACAVSLDDRIDYIDFNERYHNPAKEIGFNLALLLTNLNDHITNDARLARIIEAAGAMLEFFDAKLGRIEIIGSARRVERVYFEIPESSLEQWEKPQIKESKGNFLHMVINEPGDLGKFDIFVNFCEDAIFEMQHAESISVEEPEKMTKANPISLEAPPSEGWWTNTKKAMGTIRSGFETVMHTFSPTTIRRKIARVKKMTYPQLAWASVKLMFLAFYYFIYAQVFLLKTTSLFLLYMMTGYSHETTEKTTKSKEQSQPTPKQDVSMKAIYGLTPQFTTPAVSAFGISIAHEETDTGQGLEAITGPDEKNISETTALIETKAAAIENGSVTKAAANGNLPQDGEVKANGHVATGDGEVATETEEEPVIALNGGGESKWKKQLMSFFARNFYTMKTLALAVAFFINFILLAYKVVDYAVEDTGRKKYVMDDEGAEVAEGGEDDANEILALDESNEYYVWLFLGLRFLAWSHNILALCILLGYCQLKVPLAIFKREKEIARKMEFEGAWIALEAEEEEGFVAKIRHYWDGLVIGTRSYPAYYWDQLVKKKVLKKYKDTHDINMLMRILGMEKDESANGSRFQLFKSIDFKYLIWKCGTVLCDGDFMYNLAYLFFSVMGNYFNYFFFSFHLIDVAMNSKDLRTILRSVTHNGKQLLLTVLMMLIVVYLYTVIAFNFFRKYYVAEGGDDGEEPELKCRDMFTCFVFHFYVGVRNGGGIGDVIEEPEEYTQFARIIFDITFFFFIIVIMLAICQGLIIDAFGDLRDQLQQVEEDMESKCFICEISKDFFDKVPHGFEEHTAREHNLANYLFFLQHLINKDDTEYTGQETYVWDMYTRRCWDFFPVGDCFRKQYETELDS